MRVSPSEEVRFSGLSLNWGWAKVPFSKFSVSESQGSL